MNTFNYHIEWKWFGFFKRAVRVEVDTNSTVWTGPWRIRHSSMMDDIMSHSFEEFMQIWESE